MNHARVATDVLKAVGGAGNITAAAHCATRLRLVLADPSKVDQKALDADPDVKGTFTAGGMFQVIIGPGDVDTVYAEMTKLGVKEASKDEAKTVAAKQDNILVRFIKTIADIFVPVLPALIAGGLMMALNNVIEAKGLFGEGSLLDKAAWLSDYAALINMISAAAFAFLPVLIGFSATKRFGGNAYLGAAMGAAMVSPSLTNAYSMVSAMEAGTVKYWHLFGLDVAQIGYQAMVIPVLCVAWILSWIEKKFHKIFSGTADFLLTPLLTMLITGFLTFIAVGPITREISNGLTDGISWGYNHLGPLGGLLFGLIYSPIVVTGLHQSFPAIEIPLITSLATTGGSFIFPIASMANVAQGAAALAVFFKARDAKLKGLSGASAASALFGITEPAVFGVNLRLRWPFFTAIASAAVGGAMVSIFNIRAQALGAAGLVGFVSIRPSDIPMYLVSEVVTIVLAFGATWFYASTRGKASLVGDAAPQAEADAATTITESTTAAVATIAAADKTIITAPVAGKLVPLTEVPDQSFAAGFVGPGMAIIPSEGPVLAPISGTVILAFPTGHAYGIRTESGAEILIHIGIDTVKLEGKGFTPKVGVGEVVSVGDLLCEVDWDLVRNAGYNNITPVVVSNAKRTGGIETTDGRTVTTGDELFTVLPKQKAATTV
ncbi:MAG: sucrose-specific PTS transporter subunit IIBC [Propionibacteriaceae bacterium]